jgi:hypothetical protein
LESGFNAPGRFWVLPKPLILGAGPIYMANALNRRPADGAAAAEGLAARCCGRRGHRGTSLDEEEDKQGGREEDEDGAHGLVPVKLNRGLYFLAGPS